MPIHLSDHFSYRRMLRFSLPSVCMIVFTSVYGVVDGFFIANFVGKTAFAAVNFILPFIFVLGAVGFMFGTGGSAVVAHVMGKGNSRKAKRLFSLCPAADTDDIFNLINKDLAIPYFTGAGRFCNCFHGLIHLTVGQHNLYFDLW